MTLCFDNQLIKCHGNQLAGLDDIFFCLAAGFADGDFDFRRTYAHRFDVEIAGEGLDVAKCHPVPSGR